MLIVIITTFVAITNLRCMDKDNIYTMEQLTDMLHKKGIRPSVQRIAVLSSVLNGSKHPSAEDIYESLSPLFKSLSRTTVYNSLDVLTRNGLLRELEIESGCSRYDMAMQPDHSHFICRKCSRIIDLPMPSDVLEVPERVGSLFSIDTIDVTFRGLCPECSKQSDNL